MPCEVVRDCAVGGREVRVRSLGIHVRALGRPWEGARNAQGGREEAVPGWARPRGSRVMLWEPEVRAAPRRGHARPREAVRSWP